MRFLHTSDLHIGKTVNGFSMVEEQAHVLEQIIAYAKEYQVQAVLLSGDLYDRSVPSSQAVMLMDQFLTQLVEMGITVLAIGGNHDSGERIGFANRILEKKGLFLEGMAEKEVKYVDLDQVRFHLLPFARPAQIRTLYGVEAVTYDQCMAERLNHVHYLEGGCNVLLAHEFVVDSGKEPLLSDSETRVSVGTADQVEASHFKRFDYVALGHIHRKQKIGKRQVYYSGSPIKYSFSEANTEKAVILGETDERGKVSVSFLPLKPIHDMRIIKGRLADLISPEVVEAADEEDYMLAILTDEEDLLDPMGSLRSVYPNMMQLQWEQREGEEKEGEQTFQTLKEKHPMELFEDFFGQVTGKELSEEQQKLLEKILEQAGRMLV